MEVRPAVESDVPALLELLDQVNALHHEGRPDLFARGVKYRASQLADLLADESRLTLVAVDDEGTVLGHVMAEKREVPEGEGCLVPLRTLYVDDLCVSDAARGHGAGTALMRACEDWARENGCHNVTLHAWTLNPGAIEFYERLGYRTRCLDMEVVL